MHTRTGTYQACQDALRLDESAMALLISVAALRRSVVVGTAPTGGALERWRAAGEVPATLIARDLGDALTI